MGVERDVVEIDSKLCRDKKYRYVRTSRFDFLPFFTPSLEDQIIPKVFGES